jgi:hypothetical protein
MPYVAMFEAGIRSSTTPRINKYFCIAIPEEETFWRRNRHKKFAEKKMQTFKDTIVQPVKSLWATGGWFPAV